MSDRAELMMPKVAHVLDGVAGVYIGRQNPRHRLGRSRWANPYTIGGRHPGIPHPLTRDDVLVLYREYLLATPPLLAHLPELRRAPALLCWCRHDGEEPTPENACHADAIIACLARYTDGELLAIGERDSMSQTL